MPYSHAECYRKDQRPQKDVQYTQKAVGPLTERITCFLFTPSCVIGPFGIVDNVGGNLHRLRQSGGHFVRVTSGGKVVRLPRITSRREDWKSTALDASNNPG